MKTLKTKTTGGTDITLSTSNGILVYAEIKGCHVFLTDKVPGGYNGLINGNKNKICTIHIDPNIVDSFKNENKIKLPNTRNEAEIEIQKLRKQAKEAQSDATLKFIHGQIQALINEFGHKCVRCGKIEWTLKYNHCQECYINI